MRAPNTINQSPQSTSFSKFVAFTKSVNLAKTNRYLVEIVGPSSGAINIADGIDHENVSLMCDFVSHPALTLHSKDANLYGGTILVPDGGIDYHHTTVMSFLLDEAQNIKTYFTKWMSLIMDRDNYLMNYQSSYIASKVKIHQLDMMDNITYTTILTDVYPTEVGEVAATSQAENTFSKISVQFNFRKWEGFSMTSDIDRQKQITNYSTKIPSIFLPTDQ